MHIEMTKSNWGRDCLLADVGLVKAMAFQRPALPESPEASTPGCYGLLTREAMHQ